MRIERALADVMRKDRRWRELFLATSLILILGCQDAAKLLRSIKINTVDCLVNTDVHVKVEIIWKMPGDVMTTGYQDTDSSCEELCRTS